MKKLLITGASGFLGWNLCRVLSDAYEIQALYYRQNFEQKNISWERFNLLEENEIKELVNKLAPDVVLHAAAIANPNFCEEHPALSHHINVYATIALAEVCAERKIPLLFTSTDLVFNGNSAPYSEDDFAHPLSQYGAQKLTAEEVLTQEFDNTLVCRLPLLFGWGPSYSNNFLSDWLKTLRAGEELKAFSDEFRTAVSAQVAAEGLKKALDYLLDETISDKVNLLHLGGSERLSRYELALLIAEVFEIQNPNIQTLLRAELPMLAPRPEDVSLDSSLAKSLLNFEAESIKAQLLFLKNNPI